MTPTEPEDPEPADRPTNVIAALAAVMRDLPGIGRDERSDAGYNYRGIEQITRHAQQLLGKYGVVFVPKVLERHTKELTINGRPWTEDSLSVAYTVFGPGGTEDSIGVGPIIGVGRDNSDKGCNKAMTMAYKVALIQTMCIGDGKDDPDKDVAEADARHAPPDPGAVVRHELRQRITSLSVPKREAVRAFCDLHHIPRVTAQMDDAQVEAVTAEVDRLAALPESAPESPQSPAPEAEGESPPEVDPQRLERAIETVSTMTQMEVLAECGRRSLVPGKDKAEQRRVLALSMAVGEVSAT